MLMTFVLCGYSFMKLSHNSEKKAYFLKKKEKQKKRQRSVYLNTNYRNRANFLLFCLWVLGWRMVTDFI